MRKTDLKHATAGVVITVVCLVVLMGVLRARVLRSSDNSGKGAALFEAKSCTQCHYTGKQETKVGPGLKGLFEREVLPVSGRPVSAENVKKQLRSPYKNMPSFEDRLTHEEIHHLIDYLKSL